MFARAVPALSIGAALFLAACSPPMSPADGMETEISAGLGAPVAPLASGVYRVTGVTESGETTPYAALLAESETADPPEAIPMPEYFTLQWHPASQSYVMQMSSARLYPMDGARHVLEYVSDDDTLYLMLDVSDGGRAASVLIYSCVDLPESFRQSNEIGGKYGLDCIVRDAETVREGLALVAADDLFALEVVQKSPLPDLGR